LRGDAARSIVDAKLGRRRRAPKLN
jgi:hypothetical protein